MNIQKLKKLISNKKMLFPLILISSALVLIIISSGKKENTSVAARDDVAIGILSSELEERIEELCESVDGVDKAHVMLTLDTSEEYVFAKDTETSSSGTKSQYVLTSTGEGIELYVIAPKVRGVAVVCTGGDKATVQKTLSELISASLGISVSKISIAGG